MKQFYDGKRRPQRYAIWTDSELDRICLNCGERFGKHIMYDCYESEYIEL